MISLRLLALALAVTASPSLSMAPTILAAVTGTAVAAAALEVDPQQQPQRKPRSSTTWRQRLRRTNSNRNINDNTINSIIQWRVLGNDNGFDGSSTDEEDKNEAIVGEYSSSSSIANNENGSNNSNNSKNEIKMASKEQCTSMSECELCPRHWKSLWEKEQDEEGGVAAAVAANGEYGSCVDYGRRQQFECTVLIYGELILLGSCVRVCV